MTDVKRYRKKPVLIEASDPISEDTIDEIALWCGGQAHVEPRPSDPTDCAVWLEIPTLEGAMRGDRNDRVIRGVKGEFYPCKPDIFEATYEAVES